MPVIDYQWLVTEPNPRASFSGFDAGRRSWKRHAVRIRADQTFKEIRYVRAACGLLPRHGWGEDLFIEDCCQRCQQVLDNESN